MGKNKILIADDAMISRRMIRTVLGDTLYEFREAGDGNQALDILKAEGDIALVLCDYHMPISDGLAFVTNKNKYPQLAQIPVVIVSSARSETIIAEGQRLGVSRWLLKPFQPKDLKDIVEEVLAMGSSGA